MRTSTTNTLLFGFLLLASAIAHAQFAWIDEKGVRHYSDQPPPTTTPAAKILKAPRGSQPASDPAPATVAAATPAQAPPTLADREADYRKRHALAEANDKKAATAAKDADAKRASCEAASRNKAQLDTGRRLRSEQNVVMTEEDKAREQANIARVLKECK